MAANRPGPSRGQQDQGDPGRPLPEPDALFAELYAEWRATVVAAALEVVGTEADAEDVAQRVFRRLWRNGGWWDIKRPGSYFRQAGRFEAVSLSRGRLEALSLDEDLVDLPLSTVTDPTSAILAEELRRGLEAVLDGFPNRCRAVCELRWLEGLRNAEVADILGITPKAVEKQVTRGRRLIAATEFHKMLEIEPGGGSEGIRASKKYGGTTDFPHYQGGNTMLGFERLSAAFAGITIRTRLIAALTVVNIALAGALVFAPQAVKAAPGDPCDPGQGEIWCECWSDPNGLPYCAEALDVTEEGCQGQEQCACTEPHGCTGG